MRLEILRLLPILLKGEILTVPSCSEGVDIENNVALSVFFERGDIENIVALTDPLKVRRSGMDSSWSTRASP